MAGWLGVLRTGKQKFLSTSLLEVFIAIWMTLLTTTSYAQPGFLSIDCGGTRGNYTDSLPMTWVSDVGTSYVLTGKSFQMSTTDSNLGWVQSLTTFRYFPEGRNKYCYELPTKPNVTYLIRATFCLTKAVLNERQPFRFSASINATDWFNLQSGQDLEDNFCVSEEGNFYSAGAVLHFCLQTVIGEPFITSLELRQLESTMYSYSGSQSQYLALLFRYNTGANENDPTVRFPDDLFDRQWTTLPPSSDLLPNVSVPRAPDNQTRAEVFYVPPKVMQTGWLFPTPNDSISTTLYFYDDQVSLNQGQYTYITLYTEHLNISDPRVYSMTFSIDNSNPQEINFSNQGSKLTNPTYILSSNFLSLTASLESGVKLTDGPTLNAVEVYAQFNFNFSTTYLKDDQTITVFKHSLNLTDWQGDPCTPVPHDWLSCTLDSPTYEPIRNPCGSNRSSSNLCTLEQGFLSSIYFVVALRLSNLPRGSFELLEASPDSSLDSLADISMTSSGIDNRTFQYLIKHFANGSKLTSLDFSYNEIDTFPDWYEVESLESLNLSHNKLTDLQWTPSEDVPLPDTLQELYVSDNAITSLPYSWQTTPNNLVFLDLSRNKIGDEISSIGRLVQRNSGSLRSILVSNNRFHGIFSNSMYLSQLPNLMFGDFSQNLIEGTLNLSVWYDALKRAASMNLTRTPIRLGLFSFVNNSITGIVPNANTFEQVIQTLLDSDSTFPAGGILLGGNPYCEGGGSFTQRYLCRKTIYDEVKKDHKHQKWILISSICVGLAILGVLCIMFASLSRLLRQVRSLRAIQRELTARKVQPPFYEYSDLRLATKNFHKDNKLGHGSFGVVYMGVLPDETRLAVKKIFNSQTVQDLDDFLNEVVVITGIKHRNLVQLKGCCIKDKERMLVYEYAEKGNLAEALWGARSHGGLNWEECWNICVGVARGLAYLHEELLPSIVHRDIKPANILLDKNFKPKIADFGLALYFSEEGGPSNSTDVAGTMGYLAPEYAMHGLLSDKVDVYSYGIVVLEVLSGRKCIDSSQPPEKKFLQNWVCDLVKAGKLWDVVQLELRESCNLSEVLCLLNIGLLCVQHRPEKRPSMSQIVTMLSGSINIEGFLGESTVIQSTLSDLSITIDHDIHYPILHKLANDSTLYPMASLDSQSSQTGMSFLPSGDTSSLELSVIHTSNGR